MNAREKPQPDNQPPSSTSIWSKLYNLESAVQKQLDSSLRKRQKIEGAKRFLFLLVGLSGLALAIVSFLFTSGMLVIADVRKYYTTLVGLIVALTVFAVYITDFTRFIDIDDVRAMSRSSRPVSEEIPSPTSETDSRPPVLPDKFNQAIYLIGRELVDSADDTNRKASKMLDTGKRIAILGFVFFAVSIVLWQWYFYEVGFFEWHVYGMISCASLFLAAEIVSAWFLKQYRHFIDASTNYIQIKAVFDRYLLLKLASDEESAQHPINNVLFDVLSREINWPKTAGGISMATGFDNMKSLESLLLAIAKLQPQRPEK